MAKVTNLDFSTFFVGQENGKLFDYFQIN